MLSAGSYTVNVTDANGCLESSTVSIGQPGSITIASTSTDALCFGSSDGTASIIVSGGTSPYAQDWLGLNPTELSEGIYNVLVTDANGCQELSPDIIISQPNELTLSLSSTDALCYNSSDGTASANISGGTPSYSKDWGGVNPNALSAGK